MAAMVRTANAGVTGVTTVGVAGAGAGTVESEKGGVDVKGLTRTIVARRGTRCGHRRKLS